MSCIGLQQIKLNLPKLVKLNKLQKIDHFITINRGVQFRFFGPQSEQISRILH